MSWPLATLLAVGQFFMNFSIYCFFVISFAYPFLVLHADNRQQTTDFSFPCICDEA